MEDLQAGPSSSKDQPIFVGHCEEAGALFGEVIRRIKDANLLQCSELKILFERVGKRLFTCCPRGTVCFVSSKTVSVGASP